MQAIKRVAIPVIKRKRIAGMDIVLNVGFEDALIRFGLMIFLPLLVFLIDKHLIIYTAPIMAYLFISAITHFCLIKYVWRRYIKHEPPPPLPAYGNDPNYPEESV